MSFYLKRGYIRVKYNNLFSLQGKIAVVTGGAGLIGKELSRGLAEAGAITILAEVNKDKGKKVANELKKKKLNVIFRHLDITKEESVSSLINFIDKKYGRIDIWVNNAYPRTSDWGLKFEDIPFSSWKKNIDMHLSGYFICCQKVTEYMKRKRLGVIINLASIYGIVGPDFSVYKDTKMTMPTAYSVIKGGIIAFTKYLASYYGKYNIRVNCISPGGVYDKQPNLFVRRYIQKTPLKRMANKEDMVGAVLYLASDAGKYITGHNLVVDGGWSII